MKNYLAFSNPMETLGTFVYIGIVALCLGAFVLIVNVLNHYDKPSKK